MSQKSSLPQVPQSVSRALTADSSNTTFSLVTMELGLPFYGYGYFLATVVTFLAAALIAIHCISTLPYHTFVRNNSAVQ